MHMKSFLVVAAFALATSGFAATASYDFETDQSASFTEVEFGGPDSTVTYQYDYSTHVQDAASTNVAITSAPNGSGTTGVRIDVNQTAPAAANSMTLYPDVTGLDLADGEWRMTFDVWANHNGNAGGATGSTEFWGFGAQDDTSAPGVGSDGDDGFNYIITGDGGSGSDFRYASGTGTMVGDNSIPNWHGANATNNSAAEWGAFFPNDGATTGSPTLGTVATGATGKQWITVTLAVGDAGSTREVYFQKESDPAPVLVSRITGGAGAFTQPAIGYADFFSSVAAPGADNFVVFDNLTIDDLGSNQTVTVNAAGGADFTSIWAAVQSFDAATTGPNSGTPGRNIIEVTGFGPYDETWGNLGDGGVFPGIFDGGDAFDIRGTDPGNRPLVLLNDSGISGSGFNVDGMNLTIENLIFASSDSVAVVSDDLGFIIGSSVVSFDNCVVTSLPPSATVAYATYTQESDLPADLLDGTRAQYEGSGATVPTVVDTGDNAFFIGLFNGAGSPSVTFNDTVITQHGQDQLVLYANGTTTITGDSKVTAGENWGIQSGNTHNIIIQGSAANPIEFDNNQSIGIRTFSYGSLDLDYVSLSGNGAVGLFLADDGIGALGMDNLVMCDNGSWGMQVFSDAIALGTLSNSIIWGNGADSAEFTDTIQKWDGGGIETLADAGTFDIVNSTIGGSLTDGVTATVPPAIRVGRNSDSAAAVVTISDTIIAGPGDGVDASGQGGGSTTINFSGLPTAGANALTNATLGTVTLNSVINDDPFFTNTTCGATDAFNVNGAPYETAGTGGTNLDGAAAYTGALGIDFWSTYE